jgi:hypothetical protein
MAFALPDKGSGANDVQSIVFSEYLEALWAGIEGIDCVLVGCAVTAQGSPDMTVAVSKGAVLSNGTMRAVAAGNVTITAADATNPRLDLVVVDSSGTKAARAGTAAANPAPPARTANDVVLAVVYVPANDTTISTNQISDLRVMRTQGPICIYKTTTAETTNTTAAAIEALNKANSGVTIPDGLFLAGRVLRVRMGGNMLLNSGTPTVRVVIAYGGTTMFSDISAASTLDADRNAWFLNFDIVAQGNADQSLNGYLGMGIIAAKTAPTTGIGDAWSTAENIGPVSGAAAVDSNAANRLLSVQITFSVSNAANELVVESATVELL